MSARMRAVKANEIPLIVGVTGHRDLDRGSTVALEELVRQCFRDLQSRCPHTPLELLSALAEGADRLVARVALSMNISLVVPLPMPIADCCEDFESDDSRREFESLLASATRHYVIPAKDGHGSADRPACYERLAAHLAHRSHVVIALWDGKASDRIGGTADVVRMKKEGTLPQHLRRHHLLDLTDTGPIHHIVAARQGAPAMVPSMSVLWPRAHGSPRAARKLFDAICRRTDEFNADVETVSAEAPRSSELVSDPIANETLILYKSADALAQRFRSRTQNALIALLALVFLGIIPFELYAHHAFLHWSMLALYLLFLGSAYLVHRLALHRRFHGKYLDYRALAEGLRVQYYWRVAGLTEAAADYYMRHQRDELHWIRCGMRRCEVPLTACDEATEERNLRFVLRDWVEGQHHYFHVAVTRHHDALHRLERRMRWLIGLGVATALLLLVALAAGVKVHDQHAIHTAIVLIMALPPIVAACIHTFAEKNALSSHVKRYARARLIYDDARTQLEQALDQDDLPLARNILRELGEASLQENGDWVILHRERPLEVPFPA